MSLSLQYLSGKKIDIEATKKKTHCIIYTTMLKSVGVSEDHETDTDPEKLTLEEIKMQNSGYNRK